MTWNSTQPLPTQLISQGQATILNNFAFLGSTTGNVTPGYYKLPNGIIVQWGSFTITSAATNSQNYAIAFPTVLYNLQFSLSYDSSAYSVTAAGQICIDKTNATPLTVAKFKVNASPPAPVQEPILYWFAIGR